MARRDRFQAQREACAILTRIGIARGEDFHALPSSKVDALLDEANRQKYRKPRTASGSRGRYFHAKLQRECAPRPYKGFVSYR